MTKLLFDEMLKHTASLARIFGIDSELFSGKDDGEALALARKSGRVLITKDQQLYERAVREGLRSLLVRDETVESHIAQMIQKLGLKLEFPMVTRCASCNGELDATPKASIEGKIAEGKVAEGKIPANVLEANSEFWICKSCGKVFWKGGHWANIHLSFQKVQDLLVTGGKK